MPITIAGDTVSTWVSHEHKVVGIGKYLNKTSVFNFGLIHVKKCKFFGDRQEEFTIEDSVPLSVLEPHARSLCDSTIKALVNHAIYFERLKMVQSERLKNHISNMTDPFFQWESIYLNFTVCDVSNILLKRRISIQPGCRTCKFTYVVN